MSKINDGGPAYPCDDITRRNDDGKFYGYEVSSTGLSLRDHFAGLALQGLLTCPESSGSAQVFAISAYGYADAMLAERSQP